MRTRATADLAEHSELGGTRHLSAAQFLESLVQPILYVFAPPFSGLAAAVQREFLRSVGENDQELFPTLGRQPILQPVTPLQWTTSASHWQGS